jgi:hypothetical protein
VIADIRGGSAGDAASFLRIIALAPLKFRARSPVARVCSSQAWF